MCVCVSRFRKKNSMVESLSNLVSKQSSNSLREGVCGYLGYLTMCLDVNALLCLKSNFCVCVCVVCVFRGDAC